MKEGDTTNWCVEKEAIDFMRSRNFGEYNVYDRMKYIYDANGEDKSLFAIGYIEETNQIRVPDVSFDQWL